MMGEDSSSAAVANNSNNATTTTTTSTTVNQQHVPIINHHHHHDNYELNIVSFAGEQQQQQPSSIAHMDSLDSKSNITSQSILNKSLFNNFFLIGLLERIPLIVKLILIVSFCLVPMAIFGALLISGAVENLNQANAINKLSRVTVRLSNIVDSVQNERGTTTLFLGSSKKQSDMMTEARRETDKAVKSFLELNVRPSDILVNQRLKRTFVLFEEYLGSVNLYIKGLQDWRNNVDNITPETFIPGFQFLIDWNGVMNDLIRLITSQSLDPTFSIIHNSFNLITSFKEYRGIRRFLGTFGFLRGSLSEDTIKVFTEARIRGRLFRDLFSLQVNFEVYEVLDSKVLNNSQYFLCEEMETYIQENYINLTKHTATEWYNNMTLCMDSLQDLEARMRSTLLDYSNQIASVATNSLIAYTISILLIILLALLVALIFSKTILGPWKNMLHLQEDMVHKFVPREFMSIINKEKVTDLHHGDFFEKELDIMFVDIRNYTALSERLPTDQMFKFLNRYLALVGPIVRRNSGYVDKYMGDGFIALFSEPGHALKASVEIQNCVRVFNDSLPDIIGPISVGCGIGRGKCAVGLIGESKRMDPTIVGDSGM